MLILLYTHILYEYVCGFTIFPEGVIETKKAKLVDFGCVFLCNWNEGKYYYALRMHKNQVGC